MEIEDQVDHVVRVEPSCTKAGNIEYWFREAYNDYYSDEALEQKINREDTVLPSLNHGQLRHIDAVEVSCEENGNIEYWQCEYCGLYFGDAAAQNEIQKNSWAIQASGHNMVHHNAAAATCTAAGHDAYDACTRCNYKEGYNEIPAQGHTWDHSMVAGGFLKDGVEYDFCTKCQEKQNEKVLPGYANYYVKSLKVKKGKKSFTVKWKKQSKANLKQFNGYQIMYSLNADMSNSKTATAGKKSKSKKIKGLQKKTTYYVQVRTFTVTGGNTYYSNWSPKKTVKTK